MASKNIEITTAQNVIITYELATVMNRCMAGLADATLIWLLNLLSLLIIPGRNFNPATFFPETVFYIWMYQLFVILFFNCQSVGMRMAKIRILDIGGKNLEFSDYFLRWIMRPIDITLSCCSVGIFSMLATEKRQRLGDLLAGTAVIKVNPGIHFGLKDILLFHQNTVATEIQYPGIKHVEEKDMLFLKNLLQNKGTYNEDIYRSAIAQAAEKFAGLLQLEEIPKDKRGFLQQLVNEYVVITR